ncbi:hypothetical protein THRCLA_08681 [Thraustotheca clavata]|uniref:Mbre TPR repeat protein n=1 Tax=Thraustotheca clavata TaxID=74557 RepID=A0A1V9Z3W5_9STRA|nr:hypothetical protein THRCLA_08681 [Thraustotheca clavata]
MTSPVSRPLGVKLSYFHHLIEINGGRDAFEGLTTAQVCMNYVIPMTAEYQLSLVEHLAQDPIENHFVAPANWYISHTWLYLFLETVDSLERFFEKLGLTEDAVVWFCVFNNNQHLSHTYPFEFWSTTFQSQLQAIGNVVMIMHPWDDPIVLKRSWCVFEVYVSIKANARFEMAMASTQQEAFFKDIENERAFMKMLGTIKSENSVAAVASDRDGIFEMIRSEVSFEKLDQMVFTTITKWIKNAIREHIDTKLTGNIEEQAKFWRSLAQIHYDADENQSAVECLTKSLSLFTQVLGKKHRTTCEAKSQLCRATDHSGQPRSVWEPMYVETLQEQTELFGEDDTITTTTRSDFATAYYGDGQFKKSCELFEQCYNSFNKVLGPNATMTITAMNNVGTILSVLHQYDKALPWQLECLKRRQETLGAEHPLTVQSMNNLGMLYRGHGDYNKAYPLLFEASNFYKRVFGLSHISTWTSLVNLANLQTQVLKYDEAKANLDLVWPHIENEAENGSYIVGGALSAFGMYHWRVKLYSAAHTYFERSVAWRNEHAGPSKEQTKSAADVLYLFQKDPSIPEVYSSSILDNVYASTEFPKGRWPGSRCDGCFDFIMGNLNYCAVCPKLSLIYCDGCKDKQPCDHNQMISVAPPESTAAIATRCCTIM